MPRRERDRRRNYLRRSEQSSHGRRHDRRSYYSARDCERCRRSPGRCLERDVGMLNDGFVRARYDSAPEVGSEELAQG